VFHFEAEVAGAWRVAELTAYGESTNRWTTNKIVTAGTMVGRIGREKTSKRRWYSCCDQVMHGFRSTPPVNSQQIVRAGRSVVL